MNVLETEIQYYNDHKDELLRHHEGQFVLIHEDRLLGAFTTQAEAYAAALERVGNKAVLIRQVLAEEPLVQYPALVVGALRGTNP